MVSRRAARTANSAIMPKQMPQASFGENVFKGRGFGRGVFVRIRMDGNSRSVSRRLASRLIPMNTPNCRTPGIGVSASSRNTAAEVAAPVSRDGAMRIRRRTGQGVCMVM